MRRVDADTEQSYESNLINLALIGADVVRNQLSEDEKPVFEQSLKEAISFVQTTQVSQTKNYSFTEALKLVVVGFLACWLGFMIFDNFFKSNKSIRVPITTTEIR